jgi:hypothetical protein
MSGVLCGRGVDLWASKIVELQAGRYKLQVPRAGASSRLDCLSLLLRGTRARRSSNQASEAPAGTANHNNLRASHSEAFLFVRSHRPATVYFSSSPLSTAREDDDATVAKPGSSSSPRAFSFPFAPCRRNRLIRSTFVRDPPFHSRSWEPKGTLHRRRPFFATLKLERAPVGLRETLFFYSFAFLMIRTSVSA